jgi:drug/metabolite transporter (DMT)-like permease
VTAFALAGIFSTYLGRWLVFKSIESIGPSGASALQSTSPLLTALFAWVFLGEVIGWMGVSGITLAILGLMAMSRGLQKRASDHCSADGKGRVGHAMLSGSLIFGIASSAAYSGSHLFRGSAVRVWNEPLLGATIGAAAGLLVLLLASRTKLKGYRLEILANPRGAALFTGIGVLQFIAQSLVIASMKYIPVSVAALISMCTPLIVMPLSYFLLRNHEKLNWVMALGIFITLCGAAMSLLFAGQH